MLLTSHLPPGRLAAVRSELQRRNSTCMPVTAATGGEQPPLGSQDELGASTAVDETIPPRAAATDGSDTAAGGADDRAAKVARIDGARTLRDRATLSSTAFYEPAETPRDFSTGARKEQGQGAAARLMEQLRQSQNELAAPHWTASAPSCTPSYRSS